MTRLNTLIYILLCLVALEGDAPLRGPAVSSCIMLEGGLQRKVLGVSKAGIDTAFYYGGLYHRTGKPELDTVSWRSYRYMENVKCP